MWYCLLSFVYFTHYMVLVLYEYISVWILTNKQIVLILTDASVLDLPANEKMRCSNHCDLLQNCNLPEII